MWSKVLKSCLAVCVVLMMVIVIPMGQASAIGVDTLVKATGGKMVVRGLAEKAGMALSPKQLDNMVDVIEKRTYDGDPKAIDFMTKANNVIDMPSETPASKTGFKKYVVDPLLWVSGLDLIFDVVDGFQDGYDNQTEVDVFRQCLPDPSDYSGISSSDITTKWYIEFNDTAGNHMLLMATVPLKMVTIATGEVYLGANTPFQYTQHKFDTSLNKYTNYSSGNGYGYSTQVPGVTYWVGMGKTNTYVGGYDYERGCSVVPVEDDVVDISKVDNSTKQHFDNDTYNTNTVYNIELELPDSPDYNDTTTWNEPDVINIENEIDIDDSDGDGIGGGDDDSDGDGSGSGQPVDWLVVVDDEIPIHEKFFLEMAEMGQKIEDMYNGVTHFFQVSTDGFQSLTDGMAGYVAFLDDFFDWLPSEYVALLGSGFTLGVVSFFLRR